MEKIDSGLAEHDNLEQPWAAFGKFRVGEVVEHLAGERMLGEDTPEELRAEFLVGDH